MLVIIIDVLSSCTFEDAVMKDAWKKEEKLIKKIDKQLIGKWEMKSINIYGEEPV